MESYYEQLLERSNKIQNRVSDDLATLVGEQLNWKETPKRWSILEVIDHLNKVYDVYLDNFEKIIQDAPKLNGVSQKFQRTILGRLSIYTNKPKGNKRKFKVKTFDFFQPSDSGDTNAIIEEFKTKKQTFNSFIREARFRNLYNVKIPTALGERVKFYVPECFDFLLAHEERHMVQIEGILEKLN